MKERALVITPRAPWPPDDGGRIVMWQTVSALMREFAVTLITLEDPAEIDRPIPAALESPDAEVIRIPHRPRRRALLDGLVGRWPYTLARFRNARLDATLREFATRRQPRLALINHLHLTTYLEALGNTPVVLREHNLEFRWMERYAANLGNPLARAYASLQARRMRATEAERCARVELVLAIQEDEAGELRSMAPGTRVEVVPVGVDLSRFSPRRPGNDPIVLLTGSFGWAPNADGAIAFLERGWPRTRARVPDARLRLVGKKISERLAHAARTVGAEPVGYVDNMEKEFASAAVMVVPLWVGAGARVKIVEALGFGLPVVGTPLAAEGLGLDAGVHLLEASEPEGLADAVSVLLESPPRAASIAAAGRDRASRDFSLEAVERRIVALCRETARRRQP